MLNLGSAPFDRNLILTGYIGAGQQLLGRQIALRLRMPLASMETRIAEMEGISVENIRARYGETRLKTLESQVLQEFSLYRGAVVLVGAQTLLQNGNFNRLHSTGPVICLVANLDSVLSRLHLSLGARYHDPNERALALGMLKREWSVRHLPGVVELDATRLNEAQVVDAVINTWQEQLLAYTA